MKIIHISDLHFSTPQTAPPYEQDNISAANPNEKSTELLKRIYEKYFCNDVNNILLITGDITDNGTKDEWSIVRQELEKFKNRLILLPGNHDYGFAGNLFSTKKALYFDQVIFPELCSNYTSNFTGYLQKNLVNEIQLSDKVRILIVNSNKKTHNIKDWARGEVGEAQMQSLKAKLSSNLDAINIVCLHHRPQNIGIIKNGFLKLEDYREFVQLITDYNVSIVAFGHSGNLMGIDFAEEKMEICSINDDKTKLLNANSSKNEMKCYEICSEDISNPRSINL